MSSKGRLFHSFHISHIKQAGTMFQVSEPCLPNQFLHLNNEEASFPRITQ